MAKLNKLEAEILIEQDIGNIRANPSEEHLTLASKNYQILVKNLKKYNIEIHKEISEKVVLYSINQNQKSATIPLDSKITTGNGIIESEIIQMNLKDEKELELILTNYEKIGKTPRYIGGSQSATYGIKCIVKISELDNDNIVSNVKKALEETYQPEPFGKPLIENIPTGSKFAKYSNK